MPEPHKKDHSSDCQAHDYAASSIKFGNAGLADSFQSGPIPITDLFRPLDAPLDRLVESIARVKSYHSPPARAIYSALRI